MQTSKAKGVAPVNPARSSSGRASSYVGSGQPEKLVINTAEFIDNEEMKTGVASRSSSGVSSASSYVGSGQPEKSAFINEEPAVLVIGEGVNEWLNNIPNNLEDVDLSSLTPKIEILDGEKRTQSWSTFKASWDNEYSESVRSASTRFADGRVTRNFLILQPLRSYFAHDVDGKLGDKRYLANEFIIRLDGMIEWLLEQYADIDGACAIIDKMIEMRAALNQFPDLLIQCVPSKGSIKTAPFNDICVALDEILGGRSVGAGRFIDSERRLGFDKNDPRMFDPMIEKLGSEVDELRLLYIKLKAKEVVNAITSAVVTVVLAICDLVSNCVDLASRSLAYAAKCGKSAADGALNTYKYLVNKHDQSSGRTMG